MLLFNARAGLAVEQGLSVYRRPLFPAAMKPSDGQGRLSWYEAGLLPFFDAVVVAALSSIGSLYLGLGRSSAENGMWSCNAGDAVSCMGRRMKPAASGLAHLELHAPGVKMEYNQVKEIEIEIEPVDKKYWNRERRVIFFVERRREKCMVVIESLY